MVLSLDDMLHLAEQLTVEEQNLLIYKLRLKQADHQLSRVELIKELSDLRASGAFDIAESLYGKYANQSIAEVSEEEFHAQMHLIATEWEQELDAFDISDTP